MQVKNKAIKTKAVSGGKHRGRLRIVDVRFTANPDGARRLAAIYDLLLTPSDEVGKDRRNQDTEA